jgi:hypothetical protein
MQVYELEKLKMKRLWALLLSAVVAAAVMMSPAPVAAARSSSVSASGPEATSDASDLRLPDPHKELRHLSKNLKLKKDQRADVSFILQERTREIHLLLDIESLSQDSRNALATKVMEDSNAQIETLLRNKQKRKFDKELAKNHETR